MKEIFTPRLWTLKTLVNNVYRVPVYQRPYSWKEEQVKTLLHDILEAFRFSKEEPYFTGNIMLHTTNETANGTYPIYEITDGQQRITTFVLMLLSLYAISCERSENLNHSVLQSIRDALWKQVNLYNSKDIPLLKLNSIEKNCMTLMFEYCFDEPLTFIDKVRNYDCISSFEANVINNILLIYETINLNIIDTIEYSNSILHFSNYLLNCIQFISIEIGINQNLVFSVFESINSKGKKLEEIDLIKTYIFSKLESENYEQYLKKWGELIIATEDNLYDYLMIFIRSSFTFYKNNITILNFKKICEREMLSYYNCENINSAICKFIDDLHSNADLYELLVDCEEANKLFKNKQFRYYYALFTAVTYKHPKSLFFRIFMDFKKGLITKEESVSIIIETIKFMVEFLTISKRDSKDAIPLFQKIMNEIYCDGKINADKILYFIHNELVLLGINKEKIVSELANIDAYESNRKLSVWLLSLYESSSQKNNKNHISYDQAYTLFDMFKEVFSLDHLLVRNPDENSINYKYYKQISNNEEVLRLKEGHDFPLDKVQDGMEYEVFVKVILNKLGNVRIYYSDKNSSRGNNAIELKEYGAFTMYSDVVSRQNDILFFLADNIFTPPKFKKNYTTSKQSNDKLPKMRELIESGYLNIGDKLIIPISDEDTPAELIDDKRVLFKGDIMSVNDWGCLVTGWSSIRIYTYTSIEGEEETLQDKRLRLINEQS